AKGLEPKPPATVPATGAAPATARAAEAEKPVTLALHLAELTRSKTDGPWDFSGTLSTTQLGMHLPLSISAAKLNVVAKGDYMPAAGKNPAALNFTGIIAGIDMLVSHHLLETLTTHVEAIASEHVIHFTDIKGQ